ncbi:stringent starvation protein b [Asticcacaulis sp. AC460]|uniref:SspB family protein n=1 Tax=Asticcacaulis sp. AC460 TaxID=1282360 RepID=UPI0003C40F26|nr:ClpXP protease specificity-enhancing factor SspB [Asticcacaulis sp. AC460]ESQ86874.1 stringent starvation protein b [Asticcacaulis sp. AC460]
MTDDQMPSDLMDYATLTQNALRGVIRQALQRAASPQGLPGEHHFYVTFLTRGQGVSIPEDLLARYPYDITIVLQHQYRDLRVADDFFRVTLTFGGAPKVLTVPYAAITRFHDPFAQFMLEFEVEDATALTQDTDPSDMIDEADTLAPDLLSVPTSENQDSEPPEDGPKVVSLDQFRKK